MMLALAETPSSALSAARQALARHQASVAAASDEVTRCRLPWDRLRAQGEAADIAVRTATAACAAVDELERADLVAMATSDGAAKAPSRTKERTAAERQLTDAKRRADIARRALADVAEPYQAASRVLGTLQDELPGHLRGVLAEQYAAAVQLAAEAARRFATADLSVRALLEATGSHGRALQNRGKAEQAMPWFRALEQWAQAYGESPRPEQSPADLAAAAARWSAFMARLGSDPTAEP